jgi:large subunit ribosomal protein L18
MSTQSIRKNRTAKKITFNHPVIVVSRSNKNIVAQVIDCDTRNIVFTANSNKISGKTKTEKATTVASMTAEYLKKNNIAQVVFNRNGYLYHGRVKALADGIREAGITI